MKLSAMLPLALLAMAALLIGLPAERGYRVYIVHTGSMSPTYRPGDLVVDAPPRPVRPGDVITFLHSSTTADLVTHRVTSVSGGVIHTKGDANATPDLWRIPKDRVRGVVVGSVPLLGFLLVFFQQPTGIAAAMTSTLSLALLWGLFFPSTLPMEEEGGAGTETHAPLDTFAGASPAR